jgi:hypothetical protein
VDTPSTLDREPHHFTFDAEVAVEAKMLRS